MDVVHLSDRYRDLRHQLERLHAQPVKDMRAIDEVIEALGAEQLRLKALDGQPGNNPIEGSSSRFDRR